MTCQQHTCNSSRWHSFHLPCMPPCWCLRSTGRAHLSVQQACVTAQDEEQSEWTWNEVTAMLSLAVDRIMASYHHWTPLPYPPVIVFIVLPPVIATLPCALSQSASLEESRRTPRWPCTRAAYWTYLDLPTCPSTAPTPAREIVRAMARPV